MRITTFGEICNFSQTFSRFKDTKIDTEIEDTKVTWAYVSRKNGIAATNNTRWNTKGQPSCYMTKTTKNFKINSLKTSMNKDKTTRGLLMVHVWNWRGA